MSVHLHSEKIDRPDAKKSQQTGVDKGSPDPADQKVVCDQEIRFFDDRDETGDDLSDRLQKQAYDHEINRDQRQKPELLKSCEWVGNCHVRVLSRK